MGTPATSTPVRVARGTYSNLNTNKADILEGEICYAHDQNKIYIKEGSNLEEHTIDTSSFALLAGSTFTGDVVIDNAKELRFHEADGNGSNYVGFEAPATLGGDKICVLPSADGSAGQYLKTDGSGNLGWATDATTDATKMPLAGGSFTGDVLIDNQKDLRFGEAVKHLASLAGMQPYMFSKKDEERERKWKEYNSIFNSYVNFYHDQLLRNDSLLKAREYLKNRSLNKDEVKKFKIGYIEKNSNFF